MRAGAPRRPGNAAPRGRRRRSARCRCAASLSPQRIPRRAGRCAGSGPALTSRP
jgi:hypothetical protein